MADPQHFYGYRALTGQPCVLIRIEYRTIPGLDIATLDDWLANYFAIDPGLVPVFATDSPAAGQAADVVSRALALYGEMVTIVGVPCSRPGRVVTVDAIAGRTDAFHVGLALTVMDNLSPAIFVDAFRDALKIVREDFAVAPDRPTAEALMARMQAGPIKTLEERTPYKIGQQSILDMADRQGVPYRHLGLGIVRLGWGSRSRLLKLSTSDADGTLGHEICGNKQMTSRTLRAAGFPAAENVLVPSAEEALAAAERFGWPVVVKPPHRERSEGVTTNIRTPAELAAAYEEAAAYDRHVLVERHADGDCHRIFVTEGRVIYVIRRVPKNVVGDGRRTVTELAEDADRQQLCKPLWRRLKLWTLDPAADAVLARQGVARDTVIEAGRRVLLRDITSHEYGGEALNFTETIHADNAQLAIDVTRFMGLAICGVDLMSTDITRPWHETGGVINELNFRPEFRWWDREPDSAKVIDALLAGNGRIPVHLVLGQTPPIDQARAVKEAIARNGLDCYLTTADHSEDGAGRLVHMPHDTLFERGVALTMRQTVDALVIAGVEADLMSRGSPVDRFDSVLVVDSDVARAETVLRRLKGQVAVGTARRVDG